MYNKLLKICVLVFISGLAFCLYFVQKDRAGEAHNDSVALPERVAGYEVSESKDQESDNMGGMAAAYVCGEVLNPGVYELPADSRLEEYIKAAGGFTENALLTSENLARHVKDGEKIYIPKLTDDREVSENDISDNTEGGIVNINNASEDQLTSLPGIGRVRAQSIIEYRRSNGGFSCIEDIMKVDGIKESVFNKIKEKITV